MLPLLLLSPLLLLVLPLLLLVLLLLLLLPLPVCATLVLVWSLPKMAVSRCCFVGWPGCAALVLLVMIPSDEELELAVAPACWLSAARNMAVKRRCLVFRPI